MSERKCPPPLTSPAVGINAGMKWIVEEDAPSRKMEVFEFIVSKFHSCRYGEYASRITEESNAMRPNASENIARRSKMRALAFVNISRRQGDGGSKHSEPFKVKGIHVSDEDAVRVEVPPENRSERK